nr:trypsin-like peptidase domain-containing protein [uncultured Holophaga sp.]
MKTWITCALTAAILAPALGSAEAKPAKKSPEELVVEANRKISGPRPLAPKRPLTQAERQRVGVFRSARKSVVFIASAALVRDVKTRNLSLVPAGSGTGFVWDEAGHVVTNLHVIMVQDQSGHLSAPADLVVTLADGKTYRCQVIGISTAYDVAVLQVFAPLKDMKPLPIGSSGDLVVGQDVMAIGNPFGLDHTLTQGIVSALGRQLITLFDTTISEVIQTDAAINPGNSGGPLLDSGGRLVGMNTAIAPATGASVGIGFAIPADILRQVVPTLIRKGVLDRPHLGFEAASTQVAKNLGVNRGVVISDVEEGGPAARAGLRPLKVLQDGKVELGDVIVGYQGQAVSSVGQLWSMMEQDSSESERSFDVVRGGKIIRLVIKPGKVQKAKTTI